MSDGNVQTIVITNYITIVKTNVIEKVTVRTETNRIELTNLIETVAVRYETNRVEVTNTVEHRMVIYQTNRINLTNQIEAVSIRYETNRIELTNLVEAVAVRYETNRVELTNQIVKEVLKTTVVTNVVIVSNFLSREESSSSQNLLKKMSSAFQEISAEKSIIQYIFWTAHNPSRIYRTGHDGSGLTEIVREGIAFPSELVVLPLSASFSWYDYGTGTLEQIGINGEMRTILRGKLSGGIIGLNDDGEENSMLWYDLSGKKLLQFVYHSKSFRETATPFIGMASAVCFDTMGKKVYWFDCITQNLKSAYFDGSGASIVTSEKIESMYAIIFIKEENCLFWTDPSEGKIVRYNLADNRSTDVPIRGLVHPSGLAFDSGSERLYFCDYSTGIIGSARIDGSSQNTIVKSPGNPRSLGLYIR